MLEWDLRPWAGAAYGRNTAFSTGVTRYAMKFAYTKAYPWRDGSAQRVVLTACCAVGQVRHVWFALGEK